MSSTINASTASGGGVITSADASGVLALQTAGVTALSIDASQKVTFANSLTSPTLVTPVINGMASSILTSGTAVASTSGTSIDFTGIPSWVKRITVMFNGVSTNGTSNIQVQIGSGSVTTTGYLGFVFVSTVFRSAFTSGFITTGLVATDSLLSSQIVLTLFGSNTWVESAIISDYSASVLSASSSSGKLVLGGTLDRVRITTVNGTDTFDAGSINIMYE